MAKQTMLELLTPGAFIWTLGRVKQGKNKPSHYIVRGHLSQREARLFREGFTSNPDAEVFKLEDELPAKLAEAFALAQAKVDPGEDDDALEKMMRMKRLAIIGDNMADISRQAGNDGVYSVICALGLGAPEDKIHRFHTFGLDPDDLQGGEEHLATCVLGVMMSAAETLLHIAPDADPELFTQAAEAAYWRVLNERNPSDPRIAAELARAAASADACVPTDEEE